MYSNNRIAGTDNIKKKKNNLIKQFYQNLANFIFLKWNLIA